MQFKLDLVVLCAYSVVTPHQLPGVPELSKLQSAGASPEEAAARARVFPRSVTSRYWKRTKLIACRVLFSRLPALFLRWLVIHRCKNPAACSDVSLGAHKLRDVQHARVPIVFDLIYVVLQLARMADHPDPPQS
jgi:hypothetical protein